MLSRPTNPGCDPLAGAMDVAGKENGAIVPTRWRRSLFRR